MQTPQSDTYQKWYKLWYEKNRDAIIERSKERRHANPDAIKAYNREYYQKNKDKIQEYNRNKKQEYYKTRPESVRQKDAERKREERAKKREERAKKREERRQANSPDARKLPKEYKPTKSPQAFGLPQKSHQKKKLLENCPLGFFEEPGEDRPFQMTFE